MAKTKQDIVQEKQPRSLIAPQEKVEKKNISTALSAETFDLLERYREFLENSPQGHVLEGLILYVTKRDTAFQRWLKQHPKTESIKQTAAA